MTLYVSVLAPRQQIPWHVDMNRPGFNKAFIMTLESSLISKLKILTFPLDKAASKRTLLEMLFEPGRFILPTACEF